MPVLLQTQENMTEMVQEVQVKMYLTYLDTLTLIYKKKLNFTQKEMFLVFLLKQHSITKTIYTSL